MTLFGGKKFELTNTLALQLFQLLRQGFLILVAVVLARSYLTEQQVGNYEMLTYLAYLLTFCWVSGTTQALLAVFPVLHEEERPKLIFQAFLFFSGLIAIVLAVVWGMKKDLLLFLFQKDELSYLAFFSVFLLGNIPASLQEYFYLLQNRPKALLWFGGITSLLQFLSFAIPIYFQQNFSYVFIALAVLGLLKWCWIARYSFRYGKINIDFLILKKWWNVSWPLVIYAFIGAISVSVGPWFVGYFSEGDETQFAIFRYGARELPLLTALAGALGSSLIPVIADSKTVGLLDLKLKSARLYHLLFPVSIIMMLTSSWWFVWVFGIKYAAAIPVFNTFLLAVIAHMIFARTVLIAVHDTHWIPLVAVFGVCMNIIGCYFVGEVYGLTGIAAAIVFALCFEKILLMILLWKRQNISVLSYTNVLLWFSYTMALILAYIWIV